MSKGHGKSYGKMREHEYRNAQGRQAKAASMSSQGGLKELAKELGVPFKGEEIK